MSVWVRSWYSKASIAQATQHWSRHIILYFFTFLMWFLVDLEFIRRSHWRFQTSHFISKQEQKKEVNSSNREIVSKIFINSYTAFNYHHIKRIIRVILVVIVSSSETVVLVVCSLCFRFFFCCCVLGGRNKLEMVIKCIWLGTKWEPKMWTQMERNSDLWWSEPKKSRER